MFLRAFLLACLCLSAAPVFAKDYGKWLCTDCVVRELADSQVPNTPEIIAFIKSDVNKTVPQWRPGDSVTVCDGQKCASFVYHAMGSWNVVGPLYNDPRVGYKNVSAGSNVSSSPAGSFGDMTVSVSWRLVDVFILDHGTGHETYLGSYYEITGISVGGNPIVPIKTIPM